MMDPPLSLLAIPAELRLLIYSYLLPDLFRGKKLTVPSTIERRLDSKDRSGDWTEDDGRDADYLKSNGVDENSDWMVVRRLRLANPYNGFSEARILALWLACLHACDKNYCPLLHTSDSSYDCRVSTH